MSEGVGVVGGEGVMRISTGPVAFTHLIILECMNVAYFCHSSDNYTAFNVGLIVQLTNISRQALQQELDRNVDGKS